MSLVETDNQAAIVAVTNARNTLLEAKKVAPESELHVAAMKNLADLLARNPRALEVFCTMQEIVENARK